MKKTYFGKIILVGIFLFGQVAWATDQIIQIDDPWVREAPPNVKSLAAYMTIENISEQPQILTSVSSSKFVNVMIHKTITHESGMTEMVHKSQLVIEPQSKVVLAPGGYHLMLMMPKNPIVAGDSVDFTLQFSDGKKIAIKVPVRKFQADNRYLK